MPRKTTPHLSAALTDYLAIRATHIGARTLHQDRYTLTRFIADLGDPQAHRLDPAKVEAWFAGQSRRLAPATYNKTRDRVRGLVGFCTRRGWITSDPMTEVRTRRVDTPDRLTLTAVDLLAMLDRARTPRDRAILAASMNTALRASDLTNLRVGDVDLDGGWINLRVTKTGRLDRLPITVDLDVELRRWLTWYASRVSLDAGHFLFPAVRTGEIPAPEARITQPTRIVHAALRSVGITDTHQQGFHTIRRSVARVLFDTASEQGHDQALRITAALLGHKSCQTTEVYLQLTHDRARRDVLLRGRSLLVVDTENVLALRQAT